MLYRLLKNLHLLAKRDVATPGETQALVARLGERHKSRAHLLLIWKKARVEFPIECLFW